VIITRLRYFTEGRKSRRIFGGLIEGNCLGGAQEQSDENPFDLVQR
jgi:hypothetical protein